MISKKKKSELVLQQCGGYRDFYLQPNRTLRNLGYRARKVRIGNCALNSYFENVTTWNFRTIAERSQYLAGLALQIWNKRDWNRETK